MIKREDFPIAGAWQVVLLALVCKASASSMLESPRPFLLAISFANSLVKLQFEKDRTCNMHVDCSRNVQGVTQASQPRAVIQLWQNPLPVSPLHLIGFENSIGGDFICNQRQNISSSHPNRFILTSEGSQIQGCKTNTNKTNICIFAEYK